MPRFRKLPSALANLYESLGPGTSDSPPLKNSLLTFQSSICFLITTIHKRTLVMNNYGSLQWDIATRYLEKLWLGLSSALGSLIISPQQVQPELGMLLSFAAVSERQGSAFEALGTCKCDSRILSAHVTPLHVWHPHKWFRGVGGGFPEIFNQQKQRP